MRDAVRLLATMRSPAPVALRAVNGAAFDRRRRRARPRVRRRRHSPAPAPLRRLSRAGAERRGRRKGRRLEGDGARLAVVVQDDVERVAAERRAPRGDGREARWDRGRRGSPGARSPPAREAAADADAGGRGGGLGARGRRRRRARELDDGSEAAPDAAAEDETEPTGWVDGVLPCPGAPLQRRPARAKTSHRARAHAPFVLRLE